VYLAKILSLGDLPLSEKKKLRAYFKIFQVLPGIESRISGIVVSYTACYATALLKHLSYRGTERVKILKESIINSIKQLIINAEENFSETGTKTEASNDYIDKYYGTSTNGSSTSANQT